MRVFLTGGTGLVGTRIVKKLVERGDQPVVLTRNANKAQKTFGSGVEIVEGNPKEAGEWVHIASGCEGAINLAGANLFDKRWNDSFKQEMRESRLLTTEHLVQAMAAQPSATGKAKALVSTSAIGYYGPQEEEELTEDNPPGSDYMAKLCLDWEKQAMEASEKGVRVTLPRVGIVLDKEGGALATLWTPFKLGIGGKVGSGKQWMSWIHHEDLTNLYLFLLDNENAQGPYNATAPNPVRNKEFTKALGRAMKRPTILPVPAFMLRLALGEVADVVAKGQRVLPKKALDQGFSFQFPQIEEALLDIVRK